MSRSFLSLAIAKVCVISSKYYTHQHKHRYRHEYDDDCDGVLCGIGQSQQLGSNTLVKWISAQTVCYDTHHINSFFRAFKLTTTTTKKHRLKEYVVCFKLGSDSQWSSSADIFGILSVICICLIIIENSEWIILCAVLLPIWRYLETSIWHIELAKYVQPGKKIPFQIPKEKALVNEPNLSHCHRTAYERTPNILTYRKATTTTGKKPKLKRWKQMFILLSDSFICWRFV